LAQHLHTKSPPTSKPSTTNTRYFLPLPLPASLTQHPTNNPSQPGACKKTLQGGFTDGGNSKTWAYCGDINGAIFLHSQANGGQFDNMDIDCDGANRSGGACANDPSGQGETAFKDTVQSYGISDLDSNIHPYVVFGNEGASPSFNPQSYGMEPLSVIAVVCNNQVVRISHFFPSHAS
jgi:chitosanase